MGVSGGGRQEEVGVVHAGRRGWVSGVGGWVETVGVASREEGGGGYRGELADLRPATIARDVCPHQTMPRVYHRGRGEACAWQRACEGKGRPVR